MNIDHHHDNTRFGDVNLVELGGLLHRRDRLRHRHLMNVPIDAEMAMPLYVGLITDTGKFMYENTNAHTHRVAAELIEAGVNVDDTYRRLYEHVPIEKLRLVARASTASAPLRRPPRGPATSPPTTTPRPAPARR